MQFFSGSSGLILQKNTTFQGTLGHFRTNFHQEKEPSVLQNIYRTSRFNKEGFKGNSLLITGLKIEPRFFSEIYRENVGQSACSQAFHFSKSVPKQ